MELGNRIKELRIKHSLTQEGLADMLGISSQSVSKWENGVTMPDITLLPELSQILGVTIDELFNLSIPQKMKRIESKLDVEESLKYQEFLDIEDFLKLHLNEKEYQYQANYLLGYLYTHRMMSDAKWVRKYVKAAIMLDPTKKECPWMLTKTGDHICWDWDLANHAGAITFFKEVVEKHPKDKLPLELLIDNLLADRRVKEAKKYLAQLEKLGTASIILIQAYHASILLAEYKEAEADAVIKEMEQKYADVDGVYFEIAQYYAKKGEYDKVIPYYEKSFASSTRYPRYSDELIGIATIYDILGDYEKEAQTYDRLIKLYQEEWKMVDEPEVKDAQNKKRLLLERINKNKKSC